MSWFNKFERRLEPFAIQNITLYIVIAQTFVLLTWLLGLIDVRYVLLVPQLVKMGEWWRVFTFVGMPPGKGMLVAFALYLFYLYGNALEQHLGTVRYNLFLITGYLLTVGLAFVTPLQPATNLFLGGAVFLAFAFLNPDFTLNLFFILPVKIKWLALFMWAGFVVQFVGGGLAERLAVVAATGNFMLFFGRDMVQVFRTGRRSMQQQVKRAKVRREPVEPMHKCHVCGKDSEAFPEEDFRYCSKCAGDQCYCEEHLRNHEHVVAGGNEPPAAPSGS